MASGFSEKHTKQELTRETKIKDLTAIDLKKKFLLVYQYLNIR